MHPSDVPDLRTRELMTIVALAEHGTFVAAAAYLKASQPALTRTVQRVEHVLGVTLFSRSTRRVEITPAGREFVAAAHRILEDLRMAAREAAEVTTEIRGRVTVSTTSTLAAFTFPHLLRRYREARPHVDIEIREGRRSDILEDVRARLADFGVGYIGGAQDPLEVSPLKDEPFVVVTSPSHAFASKKRPRIRLVELRGEALVSLPADTYVRRRLDEAARAAGVLLTHAVTVDRLTTAAHYVRAGAGLAIMPDGALPAEPSSDLYTVPLVEPEIVVSVGLVTLRDRLSTPAAADFIALVRKGVSGSGRTEAK